MTHRVRRLLAIPGVAARCDGAAARILVGQTALCGGAANARGGVNEQKIGSRSLAMPLVNEADDLARAHCLAGLTPAVMEGHAGAGLLVAGLRRAGSRRTWQSLVDALNAVDLSKAGAEGR